MSALMAVQIVCDAADGCTNAYTPTVVAVGNEDRARRESHHDGWVSTGPRGNRKDYCPEHAEQVAA